MKPSWVLAPDITNRLLRTTMKLLADEATNWFFTQLDLFFPRRTGALVQSYRDEWNATLNTHPFTIHSHLPYATPVENMHGKINWKNPLTITHAGRETSNVLAYLLPDMIRNAFDDAVVRESGRGGLF